MSLAKAVRNVMHSRGLSAGEVSRHLGESYNRGSLWRIVSGRVTDPRLSAVIALCDALNITPTELTELAGLWHYQSRSLDMSDLSLRDTFAKIQALPKEEKRRTVAMVARIADEWNTGHDDAAASLE